MFKFRALVRDRDGAAAMGGSELLSQIIDLIGSTNASSSDESSDGEYSSLNQKGGWFWRAKVSLVD